MDDFQAPESANSEPDDEFSHYDGNAKSSAAQGSIVPLGWKPTMQKPVPVTRCIVIKKNGDRCNRWSMRGMTKCYSHGKRELNFPHVKAHKEAVVEAARMRLLDASDHAVDTLEQLLQPGTAEGIRLKAATEILDRNGIRGGFEVDVQVEEKEDPATLLAKRLLQLRERHDEAQQVLEGEVVDDSDGEDDAQETLF